MKVFIKIVTLSLAGLLTLTPNSASAAAKVVKCTKLQSKNFMLPGKCINKSDAKTDLKLFTTQNCTVCHSKTGVACPVDLGAGSCTYAKMASVIKLANDTAGNKKSVPPSVFIDQFTAMSAFMPGIATPSASQAKKYIIYLSTLKQ
jgi:hypothetical protein